MTTATDWDVRDRETNDRLTVTDVQARIDQLDGAATEAPVQIEPWTPRDPHAGERCRCGEYHESALIAPTSDNLAVEGSTVAAEMVSGIDRTPGWPTWLGAVHHADATLGSEISKTRAWADSHTARPVERTVVEPVAVDYSYRQTEAALYAAMVVSAAEEHVASVYDELAPDRIQDGPPEHDRQGQDPDLTPEHQRQGTDPDLTPEHERKADARSRAVLAPLAQPATQETPPRVGGWRVWAASAAIGIVGLAATIGALVVWA